MIVIRRDRTGEVKAKLYAALNAGLTASAEVLADQMRRTLGRDHGGVHAAAGAPPNSQSGNLRNSMGFFESHHLKAGAGSTAVYAAKMEFGGPIYPKAGKKYLAIPQSDEARKMLRGGASVRSVLLSLRFRKDIRIVYVKMKKGGTLIEMEYKGGKRNVNSIPLFLLVRMVNIKPHPWAVPARIAAGPAMEEAFIGAVRRTIGTTNISKSVKP